MVQFVDKGTEEMIIKNGGKPYGDKILINRNQQFKILNSPKPNAKSNITFELKEGSILSIKTWLLKTINCDMNAPNKAVQIKMYHILR